MQAFMYLGDMNISEFIRENGIAQSEFTRASRDVVTLDGYLIRSDIVKRRITVRLVEIRDVFWYMICDALKDRPVSVRYFDDVSGDCTKKFYVYGTTSSARRVTGGNTYFSGASFVLEEV